MMMMMMISTFSSGSRTDVGAYHRDTACDNNSSFIANTATPAPTQLPQKDGNEALEGKEWIKSVCM